MYNKGDEHKKAQLAMLKEQQEGLVTKFLKQITKASNDGSTVVAFIDEIDLVGAEVTQENLGAITIWLGIVQRAIQKIKKPVIQVAVLHPGPSTHPDIARVMQVHFSGSDEIDFAMPHSDLVQRDIVLAVLTKRCAGTVNAQGRTLSEYLSGVPGANKRMLCNNDGVLTSIVGAASQQNCTGALALAQQAARAGMDKQIQNDMRFDATIDQKKAIRFMHEVDPLTPFTAQGVIAKLRQPGHRDPTLDFEGAVTIGSILKVHNTGAVAYMMSLVYHDTLTNALSAKPDLLANL